MTATFADIATALGCSNDNDAFLTAIQELKRQACHKQTLASPGTWTLPNGWRLEPYLSPLSGEPTTGYHWLVNPQGKRCTTMPSDDARDFAAAMSTPAPEAPSREEIAKKIVTRLENAQSDFFACEADTEEAVEIVLEEIDALVQSARGTVTDIEVIDPRIDYSVKLQKIIEAICHGSSLPKDSANLWHYEMAARFIASLPSRPEPAATVVPEELQELSKRTKFDGGSLANLDDRRFAFACVDFVRDLIARQSVPPAAADEREGE